MRLGSSFDYSDEVLYNFDRNQSELSNLSKQLASGLRINSAADDPSGYAIATSIQTISQGLDQGQHSVQEANNMLTVADGATETVTEILQRMRSLAVEANSTINSAGDLANIQAEIDQLELEINRIASNANYNGKTLFDGSLTSQPPNLNNQILFVANPNTDGGNGTTPPTTPPSGPSLIVTDPNFTQENPGAIPLDFSFTVNSFDATTGTLSVTWTAQSSDATFGPPQTTTIDVAENTDTVNGFPPPFPGPYQQFNIFDQNGNPIFSFAFSNINRNDVGKTAVLATIPAQDYQQGSGLNVNVGTAEGNIVTVQIGPLSAFNLGISGLQVGDELTNQASEGRLDNALNSVNTMRAQLGAQQVSLNYANNDAATQEVNQIASESSIRDLNIGSTVTAFTKEQILVNVGTSVLSQMEVNATSLTRILISAFGG